MQRVLVALALGSAAAFAPAAQPRTSVVRFMDEDALKSAASVVIIYSIYHRRGDPMGDALSESALARGATSSTRSMSDALSESALSRHAIAQEQDLERRSRRVQQDRRRRGRDRDARGHQVRGADSRQGHGPLGRRVRHHRLRGRDEGRLRQQRHGQRRAGLHGLRSRTESRNTFTPSTTRVVHATHRSFHTDTKGFATRFMANFKADIESRAKASTVRFSLVSFSTDVSSSFHSTRPTWASRSSRLRRRNW